MVICPGGGYGALAFDYEGTDIARWLNSNGIAGIVLKYRLPSDLIMENKSIGPLQDAQEAIRIVRRNAADWKINPGKIGIMGFSAGGHLASTLSTHYADKVYEAKDTTSATSRFFIADLSGHFFRYHFNTCRLNEEPDGSKSSGLLQNTFQESLMINEKHLRLSLFMLLMIRLFL